PLPEPGSGLRVGTLCVQQFAPARVQKQAGPRNPLAPAASAPPRTSRHGRFRARPGVVRRDGRRPTGPEPRPAADHVLQGLGRGDRPFAHLDFPASGPSSPLGNQLLVRRAPQLAGAQPHSEQNSAWTGGCFRQKDTGDVYPLSSSPFQRHKRLGNLHTEREANGRGHAPPAPAWPDEGRVVVREAKGGWSLPSADRGPGCAAPLSAAGPWLGSAPPRRARRPKLQGRARDLRPRARPGPRGGAGAARERARIF
ncbi:MAG: hypothetical protein BJ554DRAFT_7303, partial [Olpidium bornovanus]